MRLTIELDMDNAVFTDIANGCEVARILRNIAEGREDHEWAAGDELPLMDYNGNRVGLLAVTEPRPHIAIRGRRWFQKSAGNTYHSVVVVVDGETLGRVDYAYGYGDQYQQTAFDMLQAAGIYPHPAEFHDMRGDMMDYHADFTVTCEDVERKRDL